MGRQPAQLPTSKSAPDVVEQVGKAERAAVEAEKSARLCQNESDSLRSEMNSLRAMLATCQSAEKGCGTLASKAEHRIRAREEALKKLEEEAKAAAAAASALPAPSHAVESGEYSKSDAPEGYERAVPQVVGTPSTIGAPH
jgi:chromosome segregation ATPase